MSKASYWLGWLMEDVECVSAEVGTPRDEQLKEFETNGFLRLRLTAHGENTYEITSKGALAFLSPDAQA